MKQTLLLVVVTIALAVGVSVYVHPDGVQGVLGMLGLDGLVEERPAAPPATERVVDRTAAAEKQLVNGDASYDAGEFDQAWTAYGIAFGAAQTDAQTRRAATGMERAVLGWALTHDPPPADYAGRTARDRFIELSSRARTERTEDAWLAVAQFAAAADLRTELRGTVSSALDLAVGGGPVEAVLRRSLRDAGPKERSLLTAMKARGLGAGLTVSGGASMDVADLHHPASDDEPSGIGGVGTAPRVRVPFGAFDAEMRERLREAAEAEAEGLEHFRLSGPDGTDRPAHRREALRLLKQARDVYNDALEMDPDSRDVERRMQTIMRALGQLNKETVAGD